ncbi:MAG: hypothetical protein IGS48_24515 [Oscillatoriales cyanobacterium C42_A2020_001]|nr:hypothetical protein [Leptolyngbyaceae cyanobacterium C42_A2020_001]
MSQNQLHNAQTPKSGWSKLLSSGILIAEAAIATVVLSVFVSSSPKLFTTRLPASPASANTQLNPPQNHAAFMQLSPGARRAN